MIAPTPKPPYWVATFTSVRTAGDEDGYMAMGGAMWELAQQQPGFLGVEHAGDGAGSITLSYWESEDAIAAWKRHADHLVAQAKGRSDWYQRFMVRVARVERAYGFEKG